MGRIFQPTQRANLSPFPFFYRLLSESCATRTLVKIKNESCQYTVLDDVVAVVVAVVLQMCFTVCCSVWHRRNRAFVTGSRS